MEGTPISSIPNTPGSRWSMKPSGAGFRGLLSMAGVAWGGLVALFLYDVFTGGTSGSEGLLGVILLFPALALFLFRQSIEIDGDDLVYRRLLRPALRLQLTGVSNVSVVPSGFRESFVFSCGEAEMCRLPATIYSRDDLAYILSAVRARAPDAVFAGTESYLPRHTASRKRELQADENTPETRVLGSHLSRREVYGSPSDNLVWGGLIFGAPILALFAGQRYPFRDPKDPMYLYASLVSFALGIIWMIIIRERAFSSRAGLGYRMVMTILGAVPIAILLMGVGFILNGQFHWR
jgi:hypothetical protein